MKSIFVIAKYTFLEIVKSKVLINVILLGFLLAISCIIAKEFTFGAPTKVAIDFGLGMMSLSSLFIAIFFGVSLIANEMENRTIHMTLSRPISRFQYLLGKLKGLSWALALNIMILSLFIICSLSFLGGRIDQLLLWSIFFIFVEAVIILMLAVMFSLFMNKVLSVIFTITILVAGHAITGLHELRFVKDSLLFSKMTSFAAYIIPNLDNFNIKNFVIYEKSLSMTFLFSSLLYAFLYIGVIFFVSQLIFINKNLD